MQEVCQGVEGLHFGLIGGVGVVDELVLDQVLNLLLRYLVEGPDYSLLYFLYFLIFNHCFSLYFSFVLEHSDGRVEGEVGYSFTYYRRTGSY